VGGHHGLDRIGNQLAAGERHLHPLEARTQAVADGDGRELERRAPCLGDPEFDCLTERLHVHVPRHQLVVGVDYSYERPVDVLRAQARGIQQRSVRRPLQAAGHGSAPEVRHICGVSHRLPCLPKDDRTDHQNRDGDPTDRRLGRSLFRTRRCRAALCRTAHCAPDR